MEIEIKASVFKKFVEFIGETIEEGHLRFYKNSIIGYGIDDGRIAFINSQINKDDFRLLKWEYMEDSFEFGVDFSELRKLTKYLKGPIEVSFIPRNQQIKMKGLNLRFTFQGIKGESDLDRNAMFKVVYKNSFQTSILQLIRGMVILDLISETTSISMTEDKLLFTSEGPHHSVKWTPDTIEVYRFDSEREEIAIVFANEYLKKLKKARNYNDIVKIYLKFEAPLRIDLTFGKNSVTSYFLAPRIYDEDEEEENEYENSDS